MKMFQKKKLSMIEDIYTCANPYPPAINFNLINHKVEFFLGDRWIEAGEWREKTVVEAGKLYIKMQLPDMENFFQKQAALDHGAEDWAVWSVRVN